MTMATTFMLTILAGLCWALGYVIGRIVALALWCWIAFVSGYKAGL